MFRFDHPEYLYTLVLIPLLSWLFIWAMHQKQLQVAKFGNPNLVTLLAPDFSAFKHRLKAVVWLCSFAILVIGLANPQWGEKREKATVKGIDVMLALDISASMLAKDITPNRIERAKRFAIKLVDQLKGDRVGLVVFAGGAYLQMPLTNDYALANIQLESIHTEMATTQGTDIGGAIRTSLQMLGKGQQPRALVVITDGETHSDDATDMAKTALKAGVRTFAVGVGTEKGSPIPTFENGAMQYKRDEDNNLVQSKLNMGYLQTLAEEGNGAAFLLSSNDDQTVRLLANALDKIEKRAIEQRVYTTYESYFQYFLAIALLLLLLEFAISYKKSNKTTSVDIFGI